MASLTTELDKAQKTLIAARRLDTTGEGEVSDAVREAQLTVEALSTAVQAAYRDAAAAGETALAELKAVREAHAKELEALAARLAADAVKDEPGTEHVLPSPADGAEGEVHMASTAGGQPIIVNVQTQVAPSADEMKTAFATSLSKDRSP